MNQPANPEMDAFKTVYDALEPLETEARQRVFTSVATMLAIGADAVKSNTSPPSRELARGAENVHDDNDGTDKYTAFAELYAEADPTSNADKALIAGYWLQVCKGTDNFSGFSINNELKNLGHKLANVTDALSKFIETKPQLVLQLKKTGKSRQARKTYKLSKAGIDRAEEMIGGGR